MMSPPGRTARLRTLLTPAGRAEALGIALGGAVFILILAGTQRTEHAISPPGFLAALVLCFLFTPRALRELVGPRRRGGMKAS